MRLLEERAVQSRADLFIAHYVAALPAAAKAAAYWGVPYAFDAEDYHLGEFPSGVEYEFDRALVRRIEGRYLRGAAFVTAASPLIAGAYADAYGIPEPMTILNVFPKKQAPVAPSIPGCAGHCGGLYWFSQTIGPGRGLEVAVRAIARCRSRPKLFLRGTPSVGYAEDLLSLARELKVEDCLQFLPPEAPADLERLGAFFDLGLVAEQPDNLNRSLCLTNKIFSYLISGLPVLASDTPAHVEIADEFAGSMQLFPARDPDGLASAIDNWLLNPSLLAEARQSAWRLGQGRFNWETESGKFIELVSRAVGANNAR